MTFRNLGKGFEPDIKQFPNEPIHFDAMGLTKSDILDIIEADQVMTFTLENNIQIEFLGDGILREDRSSNPKFIMVGGHYFLTHQLSDPKPAIIFFFYYDRSKNMIYLGEDGEG